MDFPSNDLKPHITVVGVGGAGGNAVNNMISSGMEGVSFVIANTDAQAIDNSQAETRIQLGTDVTSGLGAGARPEVGAAAAEESYDDIAKALQGSNMVFVTAGMGGGTGTGAAPVVARVARDMGILTVGVVTKPFLFEGRKRMMLAENGITELAKHVDTLIIIPNQNLFRVANEKTTFADAFRMADNVLNQGVRSITDLMTMPGLINLDFADVRTVMSDMGRAMMGSGEGSGENRAADAAELAMANPLLEDANMNGAKGVLINITGGADITLFEVDQAANAIKDQVQGDAHIIFGSCFDEKMEGKMRVSVVATGIPVAEADNTPANKGGNASNGGGTPKTAQQAQAEQRPVQQAPKPQPVMARAEAPHQPTPRQTLPQLDEIRAPVRQEPVMAHAGPQVQAADMRAEQAESPQQAQQPVHQDQYPAVEINRQQAAPQPAQPERRKGLFGNLVSRFSRGGEATGNTQHDRGVNVSVQGRQSGLTDDDVEIPAFLRRQTT